MWRAVRPSRVADMPAVVNTFWLRKGFEGLTFFGKILTPTQALADEFNTGFTALKNHEMIHLRQAQSCGDSWLRFYLLYLWYWLRALPANRKLKHGAYLLNPFEMEAYRHMHNLDYLAKGELCQHHLRTWRTSNQTAARRVGHTYGLYGITLTGSLHLVLAYCRLYAQRAC